MKTKLPNNWIDVSFTEVFDINGGTQPPKSEFISEPKEGYIRLLQIRDFGKKPVPTYIPNTGKLRICKKDDVLIARYGASIGRILTGMEGSYNVALAKVNVPKVINKKYTLWLLKSNLFQNVITSFQRTAQSGFNKNDLAGINIPIAPLKEQQRIVTKLDNLFSQLDDVKSRIDKIPELINSFRKVVLTQAVTGKLTEQWREGKELNIDIKKISEFSKKNIELKYNDKGWLKTNVDSISSRVSVGHVGRTSEFYTNESGIPFLRSQNVKPGRVVLNKIAYITKEFHEKLKKSQLIGGELLIVRVGANRGDATILPYGLGEINCANIVFARVKPEFSNYLDLLFQSNKWLSIIEELSTGTAQGVINTKIVAKVDVDLPSIKEQEEIVKRVEKLFSKANLIEKQYKNLKEKIEILPQSILHKAFKGELVGQLPTDGDAKELLKQIKILKEEMSTKGKKKK